VRNAIADGADTGAIIPALDDAQARAKTARHRLDQAAPPVAKVTREDVLTALGGTLDVASVLAVVTPTSAPPSAEPVG